ncbi:MAG TPA: GH1 family beta-glucosidase [Pseudonocardiaceae bacterium]|jgi:beta-glucosidase
MTDFPALAPDFTWGVATSAYQIEGAVAEDGRSPSIWDTYSHTPGRIDGNDTGDVACDHYHRWREDIGLMRELGVDAYRFSIAWPRILPAGGGAVNKAGIDFYDRLVDGLLEAGIRPFATLYHWDLPQVLQDQGGWPERATAERLAEYSGVVAKALGDRVSDWITINEPLCSAWIGYLEDRMAPGHSDITEAVRASYHLLLGHGLSAAAIRAEAKLPAQVGIVINPSPCEPATNSPEDIAAAERADGHTNRWWLDPVFGRGFPADMRELYGVELPEQPGDNDIIATPLDFLGVNYYFRMIAANDPQGPIPYAKQVRLPDVPRTYMDWEVNPDGLEKLLVRIAKEYQPAKIYITENGSAYEDKPAADGSFDDTDRAAYLQSHLAAVDRAAGHGVPMAGYFAWSFLDNFEWAYGYDKRFGLIHVDYETQVRTIKTSGRRYQGLIKSHRGE